mmetsp:Transcript_102788/g.267857  ORF Transcript_102788/g.267857 Transcript_102788/m.267857 type:complete len:157 (+) Transcript_102788:59-529(+)
MPVFSKMTTRRSQGKTLLAGAVCASGFAVWSAPSFLTPQTIAPRLSGSDTSAKLLVQEALPAALSAPPSTSKSGVEVGAVLGSATIALIAGVGTKSRATRRSGALRAATDGKEQPPSSQPVDSSMPQLVTIAQEVLASRGHVDETLAGRLFEYAAS